MTVVVTGKTVDLEDGGAAGEAEAGEEDTMTGDTTVETIGTVIEAGVDMKTTTVDVVGVGDEEVGMEAGMAEIDMIAEAEAAAATAADMAFRLAHQAHLHLHHLTSHMATAQVTQSVHTGHLLSLLL